LSEKQKATKRRLRIEGKYCGSKKPYGWDVSDDGKTLIPCEKEMMIIRKMKSLRSDGHTYRSISKEITRYTNKTFPHSWVHKILKREGGELQCLA